MKGYLLDTWAWIEYLEGGEAADRIDEVIENEKCYTSVQTIAELSDLYNSGRITIDMSWEELKAFIAVKKSDVVEIDGEIGERAGEVKAEERETQSDFGLADAVILATARKEGLRVVSGDPHLVDQEETVDLGEE